MTKQPGLIRLKRVLYLLISMFMSVVHAKEILPQGCKPYAIDGDMIVLTDKVFHRVVMFHNLSSTDVWLVNAQISTHIEQGRWSALALDGSRLQLQCVEARPGHEQQVSCESVLAVCQWPHSKKTKQASQFAFVGENMSLSALMAYVGRQGFQLLPDDE